MKKRGEGRLYGGYKLLTMRTVRRYNKRQRRKRKGVARQNEIGR